MMLKMAPTGCRRRKSWTAPAPIHPFYQKRRLCRGRRTTTLIKNESPSVAAEPRKLYHRQQTTTATRAPHRQVCCCVLVEGEKPQDCPYT